MIDYRKIAAAESYYKRIGYIPFYVPWTASQYAQEITLPAETKLVKSDFGYLVGSAEQSILDMICTGRKHRSDFSGRIFATTPCFRNEKEDYLHQKYFIKTELFDNTDVNSENLWRMINDARCFFGIVLGIRNVDVVKIDKNSYDIVGGPENVELGSYGIRNHAVAGPWIFGTGCAEPRLSIVRKMVKRG
jgi:hypothetical protein